MNSAFKQTLVAMATAALGFSAGCGGDANVETAEAETAGGTEGGEASCAGEGSCAGATTGDTTIDEPEIDADEGGEVEAGGEASCGEGSCG